MLYFRFEGEGYCSEIQLLRIESMCTPLILEMEVQERVMVVGRVCCEGEGHLNDNSVLLEGG